MKQHIIEQKLQSIYVLTGNEHYVIHRYIDKMSSISGLPVKWVDEVKEILNVTKGKQLVKKNYLFVLFNNEQLLKNEKALTTIKTSIGNNMLIIVYTNPDKRSAFFKRNDSICVNFEKLKDSVVYKYLQKDSELSDNSIRYLADVCDYNYGHVLLELDKVKIFASVNGITQDVALKRLVDDGIIYNPPYDAIFDFVDSVMRRQLHESVRLLEVCEGIGEANLTLISVLYNNMKQMLQVQSFQGKDICESTGLTPYQVKLCKEKQNKYTNGELVNFMRTLQKVEYGIKSGTIADAVSVRYVLAKCM